MSLFKNIAADINAANRFSLSNKIIIFCFNRGFHALLWYRISNRLYKWHIPVIPMIFTRLIQITYSIDIDYKAKLDGGIVIVHGVGLVIGSDVHIQSNVILFHNVTLGRRGIGAVISPADGFPTVQKDCIICTGAVIIGKVVIGENTTIGANCVITKDVAPNSICKLPEDHFITYKKNI